jgi:hypothetical protein
MLQSKWVREWVNIVALFDYKRLTKRPLLTPLKKTIPFKAKGWVGGHWDFSNNKSISKRTPSPPPPPYTHIKFQLLYLYLSEQRRRAAAAANHHLGGAQAMTATAAGLAASKVTSFSFFFHYFNENLGSSLIH